MPIWKASHEARKIVSHVWTPHAVVLSVRKNELRDPWATESWVL